MVPVTHPFYYIAVALPHYMKAVWGFTKLDASWTLPHVKPFWLYLYLVLAIASESPAVVVLFWVSPLWLSAFGRLQKNHIYEPRAYVTMVPFVWMLAEVVDRFPGDLFSLVVFGGVFPGLLIWTLLSHQRADNFRDECRFWSQAYLESPDNPQVVHNYCMILRHRVRLALMADSEADVRPLMREIERLDPALNQATKEKPYVI